MIIRERTRTKRYKTLSDVRWKGKLYPAGTIMEGLTPADAQQIGVGWQIEPVPEAGRVYEVKTDE